MRSYLLHSGPKPAPWSEAKEFARGQSVGDVPFAYVLDRWLQRYPGMSIADVLNMDWEQYLQLEAVQRGEWIAGTMDAEIARRKREAPGV